MRICARLLLPGSLAAGVHAISADDTPAGVSYARSVLASTADLAQWFPNQTIVVLRGQVHVIGLQELSAGSRPLNRDVWKIDGSGLFGVQLQHGFGLYNPSSVPASLPGHLVIIIRASNWHYCPSSGWDGNWSSVPHHEQQSSQYNRLIVALVRSSDLQVMEAVPLLFPYPAFRSRFQEVQNGSVLTERSIEGLEDARIYRTHQGRLWLVFSFRTIFIAPLKLRFCTGGTAWDSGELKNETWVAPETEKQCEPSAVVEKQEIVEFVPEALSTQQHRDQQVFKNFNIVQFYGETAALVEFSVNPRVLLHVDLTTGLWYEVHQTRVEHFPVLTTSQYFYRGGYCCVGPVDWNGAAVHLGVTHIKFNRYVFLHRIYAARAEAPYDILAVSPKFCLHFAGRWSLRWQARLASGCESVQFVSGAVLSQSEPGQEGKLLLTVGINDCEAAVVTISLPALLHLLSATPSKVEWQRPLPSNAGEPKENLGSASLEPGRMSQPLRKNFMHAVDGLVQISQLHGSPKDSALVFRWLNSFAESAKRPCASESIVPPACLAQARRIAQQAFLSIKQLCLDELFFPRFSSQQRALLLAKISFQRLLLPEEARDLVSSLVDLVNATMVIRQNHEADKWTFEKRAAEIIHFSTLVLEAGPVDSPGAYEHAALHLDTAIALLRRAGAGAHAKALGTSASIVRALGKQVEQRQSLLADIPGKFQTLLPELPVGATAIQRRASLSLKDFWLQFHTQRRPVVLTDQMQLFRAATWHSLEHLCGSMVIVPDEYIAGATAWARLMRAGPSWGGQLWNLSGWISDVKQSKISSNVGVFDKGLGNPANGCPALLKRIRVPKYFAHDVFKRPSSRFLSALETANLTLHVDPFKDHPSLFVQSPGFLAGLHTDTLASHFWQINLRGRKRWTLFIVNPEVQEVLLNKRHHISNDLFVGTSPSGATSATPAVEVTWSTTFPEEELFAAKPAPWVHALNKRRVEVIVEEGELIYIPSDTPHRVECLADGEHPQPCLSIAMNFVDRTNAKAAAQQLHESSAKAFGGAAAAPVARLADVLEQEYSLEVPEETESNPAQSLWHWLHGAEDRQKRRARETQLTR